MTDRLKSAWRYMGVEIWRPLFNRFKQMHEDLPIAVMRAMLDRPHGSSAVLIGPGQDKKLDAVRADIARIIDRAEDARVALSRIKASNFIDDRAIAIYLADVAVAFAEYDNADLTGAYQSRVVGFLACHCIPYRVVENPFRLIPLLGRDVDALYDDLRTRAATSPHIAEALAAFELAWARHSSEWSQINAKDAIRTASLLAENVLVSEMVGLENEFTRSLGRMRREARFPSNEFANIFDRAYTFANTYPNIRHPGDGDVVKRDLQKEDALLAAIVFVGLSACAHNLCIGGAVEG